MKRLLSYWRYMEKHEMGQTENEYLNNAIILYKNASIMQKG